jgi:16S rRNA (uracil1498-N3)-methyltransferase
VSRTELRRRADALAQFRVEDPRSPVLSRDDEHHLFKVLRARDGEEVVVTDGAGLVGFATVRAGSLETNAAPTRDEPYPTVELYLAPLKGDRSDWVIAKAVELGVTRVVPLLSDRVVVKWRAGAGEKVLARWRRIAAESAGQCRRSFDLAIDDAISVEDTPTHVAVCDLDSTGSLDDVFALAIGPEGGWAPGEWTNDRCRVGLGEGVLRAETAALAAATLLVSSRPGWSRRTSGSPER